MRSVLQSLVCTVLLAQASSFEVATVRMNHTDFIGDIESYHDGLLRMTHVTLRQCIRYAYEISEPQIAGGPKWMDSLRFDIVGKSERPYPADNFELLRMLKPLLADRFQLAAHHETRSLPGYALTTAKGGIRAAVSSPGTRYSGSGSRGGMKVTACTMAMLALRLSPILGRPVVDMTGDSGSYDFNLRWTPDEMQADPDSVSLYTALREQVGVKLESQKLPVDVLVVDRAELPSEN